MTKTSPIRKLLVGSCPDAVDQVVDIEFRHVGEREQFDHIDPTPAPFHGGDDRLIAAQGGARVHPAKVQPVPSVLTWTPVRDVFLVNGLLAPIAARLRTASERARSMLEERWSKVRAIEAALEASGYLTGNEIDALLARDGSDPDAVAIDAATSGPEVL